ncbi:MAG TPA: MmcQ/YjbR family DNA-binding protein [Candidatus Methylomirabilis sp.]|nr:MmcQ/YjbR family DNA-binding protein [Candidatus Methylomirabilis sp.]
MGELELGQVRRIALAFPGVNERLSHGEPCFFVRDKRPLCYFHDNHNGDGRLSLWCPVPADVQEELVTAEPERFFAPPTSARGVFSTWVGVFLDLTGKHKVDWDEIAALLEDAYRHVAPKSLVTELDRQYPRS